MSELDPSKFRLFGQWLAQEVGACTCAGAAPGYPMHEQGCGWEPVTTLAAIFDTERELRVLREQRQAALDLCDQLIAERSSAGVGVVVNRVRAALRG